jgi:hypothetical protein
MATLAERDTSGTLTPGEGEVELLNRRTRTAKVFHLGGRRYRIGGSIGPVHYRRDPFDEQEELKEIDLDVILTPGEAWDAACETNGYQLRFWQQREVGGRIVRYIAQFRRAGKWLAMAPVALVWTNDAGEKQLISVPQAVGVPRIDNEMGRVTWQNVFGHGLHFRYNLVPDGFFKTLIVENKASLPQPTIGRAGLRLTLVMALSWHSKAATTNGFAEGITIADLNSDPAASDAPDEELENPEQFSFRDGLARDLWWLRKPRAWDSYESEEGGPRMVAVDHRLRRKGNYVFAALSVLATALNNPAVVYPVYVDVVMGEEQVGASADDGFEGGGPYPGEDSNNGLALAYQVIGASTLKYYEAGWRFQSVPIPQGATINSASLKVRCRTTRAYTSGWRCGAEDVDSSNAWEDGVHHIHDAYAARTTAFTDWDVGPWTAGTWYNTPDISAVIEEVVVRAGWSSENNLSLMLWYRTASYPASNEYENTSQWDDDPTKAAKFNCTYTEPVSGGDWLFASD